MASKSLTFELFGVDKTASSALAGVARAGDQMGAALSRGAFVAGAALAATAAAAVAFSIDSIKAFAEAETAQTRLAFAFEKFPNLIGGNIVALQTMNTALQKTTRFEDDAIAAAQGTLAMYDLNADQLAELTPLMLDYAAATGKDAAEAAEDLGKAILGQGRALKAVGLNFEDAGDPVANYTQLVTGLRTQVQGFAEKDAQTLSGRMDQIKNQFDAVQEKLGEAFAPGLNVAADVIDNTLIPALDRIITKVGPDLQAEFDALAPRLEDAVEDAMPAVEKLLKAAPDVIGAIADSISADLQVLEDIGKMSDGDFSPIARDNPEIAEGFAQFGNFLSEAGSQFDDLINHVNTQKDPFDAAVVDFLQTAADRLPGFVLGFNLAGEQAARGLADGIRNNKGHAVLAAEEMANEVVGIVRSAMQIASPSKVMRDLGAYIPQGLALGIEDDMWRVNAAFDGMNPTSSSGPVSLAGQISGGGGGTTVHVNVNGIYAGDKNALAKTVRDVLRDGVKNGAIPAGSALA